MLQKKTLTHMEIKQILKKRAQARKVKGRRGWTMMMMMMMMMM